MNLLIFYRIAAPVTGIAHDFDTRHFNDRL